MNKRGFSSAELPICVYAIITFAVFAVLFSGIYLFVSQPDSGKTTTTTQNFKTYELLDYYLYTKIRLDNIETNLLELIPLYCLEKKDDQLKLIKKLTSILLLPDSGKVLGCINSESSCNNLPNEFSSGKRHIYTKQNNILILNEHPSTDLKIIEIPGLKKDSKACLEIEQENYDASYFIDIVYSDKDFEEKVKQKSSFQVNQGKPSFLISPSKNIWRYNNKIWCNVLYDSDDSLNCINGLSPQELINCKGDYSICT